MDERPRHCTGSMNGNIASIGKMGKKELPQASMDEPFSENQQ